MTCQQHQATMGAIHLSKILCSSQHRQRRKGCGESVSTEGKPTTSYYSCSRQGMLAMSTRLRQKRIGSYVPQALFFVAIAISLSTTKTHRCQENMTQPLESNLYWKFGTICFSLLFPALLLSKRFMATILPYLQKCHLLIGTSAREIYKVSSVLFSSVRSTLRSFGSERSKPLVTASFLTLGFIYEMIERGRYDSMCMMAATVLITSQLCIGSSSFNNDDNRIIMTSYPIRR